jgi:4-diphosphocytidyl-2-C-methyl-D-erythritol kinase
MSQTLIEFAPAKVNLHLHVTGKRADGYHLLDSLVVFADIGDRLTLTPSADLTLEVTGPFASGLTEEPDNLVLRAARAVAERAGVSPTGHFVLEKNLPVASGIGGGSSDAAAAVRLMLRQCSATLDRDTIDDIALLLGADVPVCLQRRTTRMSGIGDWLADWPPLPKVGLLLVNPGLQVPTRAVFKARESEFSPPADLPATGWPDTAAMTRALRAARNDLEAPARKIAPVIGEVLDTIAALPGCLLARMSGSGATCLGIFPDPAAARTAAGLVANPAWWCQGGGLYEDAAAADSRI